MALARGKQQCLHCGFPADEIITGVGRRRSWSSEEKVRLVGEAAQRALYTLLETAKLNRLDPEAWLRDVLTRISSHPINRIRRPAPLEHRQARTPSRRRLKAILTPRSLQQREDAYAMSINAALEV